jgi:hypothetical protein
VALGFAVTVASVASVVKVQFNQLPLPFSMLFMSFMLFLFRLLTTESLDQIGAVCSGH